MKVRTKIALILIPVAVLTILTVHLSFGLFFKSYLEQREQSQASFIYTSLLTYLSERQSGYMGSANDWAHWDDTYEYLNGANPDYIGKNLGSDTFENLDINFILFIREDFTVFSRHFSGLEPEVLPLLEEGLLGQFRQAFDSRAQGADLTGLFRLGDSLYMIAASDITDSTMEREAVGKMVIGRRVDEDVRSDMEKITDCAIENITTVSGPYDGPEVSLSRDGQRLTLQCVIPQNQGSAIFLLTKARDIFVSGMNQYRQYLYLSLLILGLLVLVLFFLLGIYMSGPLLCLIREVKAIDLTHGKIGRLPVAGGDEFAFLGRSINTMLDTIETEQNKVRESEEKLYATLSSVGDGVIAVDRDGHVLFLNPIAEKLTGWTLPEASGRDMETVFHIINEYTRETVTCPVRAVFETQRIIELANHTLLIAKDGTERSIEDTAAPIRDASGQVVGCVLVFRDSSEKKEKQRRIEYLSYHDQLTGLYNRRFFEEEIKRLDTRRNLPITFAYADVNGLKAINDAFGHQKGDQLIQKVAEVFQTECRADDIIARTGGDEFVIILPRTDAEAAQRLVRRIHAIIEKKKVMNINISISFGWDTKTREDQSVWEVLKKAENIMYQRKIAQNASNRNQVIKAILGILRQESPLEDAHSRRVGALCESAGKAFGLDEKGIDDLRKAGEYHDIGKITMDEYIHQSGGLSETEWTQIKNHPEIGYRLLSASGEFYDIAELVLAHHERWDGAGYPKGLKAESIPWKARVIAVADAYDTMTSEWPYRRTLSRREAVEEIRKNAGTQFDPRIARVFVEKVLGMEWDEA